MKRALHYLDVINTQKWERLFRVAREERLPHALLAERFGFTVGAIEHRLQEEGIRVERANELSSISENARRIRNHRARERARRIAAEKKSGGAR